MMTREKRDQVLSILWRVLKVTPVVGDIFIIAAAPIVLRRKGYLLGCLVVILDILPVICLIKGAIEVYYGDISPDKAEIDAVPTVGATLAT